LCRESGDGFNFDVSKKKAGGGLTPSAFSVKENEGWIYGESGRFFLMLRRKEI